MSAAAVAHAVKERNERRAREQEEDENGSSPKKRPPAPTVDLPPEVSTGFWKYQRRAAILYTDTRVQWSVAGLIGGNFLANVIEKAVDPTGEQHTIAWDILDMFFNLAFLVELILNMYGFWLCRFWKSGWNIFDFVVVWIGMMGVFKVPLPGPLSLLRMMRAFRVFRLFKRIKSLNKILVSLGKAVPGVANAFFILFLMMCIYSILAVEFFGDYAISGSYKNEVGDEVGSTTGRQLAYGDEYFSNFGKALFTMFQVLTAESWSEAIARPMIHNEDGVMKAFLVALYFVSFNLLNGVVLINVVIAVLLEKMVDGEEPPDEVEDEADKDSELEGEVPEVQVCPMEDLRPAQSTSASHQLAVEEVSEEPTTSTVNVSEKPRSTPDIGEIEYAFTDLKSDMSKVQLQLMAVVEELQRRQPQQSG